jgi:tRNA A-37 threonylcarbamoyl transferase component Bud32
MREIARGAEAVLYEDKDTVIKHRLKKNYRIKELDDELRKQRTRREASLLQKILIPHPKLIDSDDKEKIVMEKIKGEKLREVLDQKPELAIKIGELVAELHNHNIIHGDLTTSNMILRTQDSGIKTRKSALLGTPKGATPTSSPSNQALTGVGVGDGDAHFFKTRSEGEIVFIDFGLSFHSEKFEDKAVDIHLFKQALNSKHFKVYDKALKGFLKGYEKANHYHEIMQRLKEVELRGRYKH